LMIKAGIRIRTPLAVGLGAAYIKGMRLTRAMIFVKDLPRMTAFYGETLGLRAIQETRMDTYVEFDAGAASFALHAIPTHIAEQIKIVSPVQPRENNPVKLSFGVENIHSERKRLETLGVTILERPWGSWDGVDPEGNVFGICPSPQNQQHATS